MANVLPRYAHADLKDDKMTSHATNLLNAAAEIRNIVYTAVRDECHFHTLINFLHAEDVARGNANFCGTSPNSHEDKGR